MTEAETELVDGKTIFINKVRIFGFSFLMIYQKYTATHSFADIIVFYLN